MIGQSNPRFRAILDFILVGAFGIVAPAMLAPLSQSWGTMLTGAAMFVVSVVFLYDGLRTAGRMHR